MRTREEIESTIRNNYPAEVAPRQAFALAVLAESVLDIRDLLTPDKITGELPPQELVSLSEEAIPLTKDHENNKI